MREAPRRHRDGNGAQQQTDNRGQRQEALGPVSRRVRALAAFLRTAQPQGVRQLVLDHIAESTYRIFVAGDQERIANPAADTDQACRVEIGVIHQQGRCQRGKANGLVGAVGKHRGNTELGFADIQDVSDIGADPGKQRTVSPDLARRGDAAGFALLTEKRVGDPYRATQRVIDGNGQQRG